jgi:hypothetical protein
VTRFAGWALVLSGLVYAGFWAFAPLPLAMTIGIVATLGYSLWLRTRTPAA